MPRFPGFPYNVVNDDRRVQEAVKAILAIAASSGRPLVATPVTEHDLSAGSDLFYDATIFSSGTAPKVDPATGVNPVDLGPTDLIVTSGWLAVAPFVTIGDLKTRGML